MENMEKLMNKQEYLWPAMATIALAVMFPSYWIAELSIRGLELDVAAAELHALDFIFLAVGMLTAYVIYSFRAALVERSHYSGVDVALLLYICTNLVAYVGLFAFSLWFAVISNGSEGQFSELGELAVAVLFFGSIVISGLIEILLAILLIRDSKELPPILMPFGIICLINGMANLSIIFSFATLFLFPLLMIVLTFYFLRQPEMLEVV